MSSPRAATVARRQQVMRPSRKASKVAMRLMLVHVAVQARRPLKAVLEQGLQEDRHVALALPER